MHITSAAALLLLPLTLAQPGGVPAHPRRHHARAVVDANRPIPRAGGVIDNGTLASISEHDTQASSTRATLISATATTSATQATDDDDENTAASSSAVASASNSGKYGDGLPSTTSSALASSTLASSSTSDLLSSALASETISSTLSSIVQSTALSTEVASSTISQIASSALPSTTAHSTVVLVTTASKSQTTHKASSTAESAEGEKKSSGIGKTALIAIIVVASVVGAAGIGWTLFRKWKLRPSNRFDKRMNPIDFSPNNGDMNDDFFEKTLQRTASNSSASRQRRELVAELDDPNAVPGVPPHDFTAGTAGVGAQYAMYNQDPYAHAEQYDYETAYNQQQGGHQYQDYDQQHQYPPQALTQDHQGYAGYQGAPTQDNNDAGYADLQRGNSIGSGSGHGHSQHNNQAMNMHQHDQGVYPGVLTFPTADQYGLGRPTGGAEGPYAQAAQYRGY